MVKGKTIYFPVIDQTAIDGEIRAWQEKNPDGGALFLVAEASAEFIPEIQSIANEHNFPVTGGIFPELVNQDRFSREGAIMLLIPTMPRYRILLKQDSKQNTEVAEQICSLLDENIAPGKHALFMIFDGMIPDIGTFLNEIYLQLGDEVVYVGVNCGSETFQPVPCLFDNRQFLGNAVLTMVLENCADPVLEHGYTLPDNTIIATTTSGNRIKTIDWKPAFEVYQDIVKQQFGVDINRENFYEYAVHFPFGIVLADGECLVRIPVALDDSGSLFCVGEIPENSVITLLNAPEPGSVKTAEVIASKLDGSKEEVMLFYCAGRRMHMGEAAAGELNSIVSASHAKSVIGALSLGEIGSFRAGAYPQFHNATVVALPWCET